jgi:hypothetical protein
MTEESNKKDAEWKKKCDEVIETENKVKGISKLWPF